MTMPRFGREDFGREERQTGLFGNPLALATTVLALALGLNSCAGQENTYPDTSRSGETGKNSPSPDPNVGRDSIFGQDGLVLFGLGANDKKSAGAIGVNAYLWRATLDTLAFAPLSSADPFGGVIITDWYADPDAPNERFKMTGYILDRRLRADGVKVTLFRQTRQQDGSWQDADVNPATPRQLENAILARARQLRIDSLEGGDG